MAISRHLPLRSIPGLLTTLLLALSAPFCIAQDADFSSGLLADLNALDRSSEEKAALELEAATRHFEAQQGYLPLPLSGGILLLEKSFGGLGLPEGDDELWMPLSTLFEITDNNKVRCIADGRVTRVVPLPNFGDAVFVRHGAYVSVYSMLKASYVNEGQLISQGQTLGVVGKGYEEGILHFELRKERDQINPLKWLEASSITTNTDQSTFRIR